MYIVPSRESYVLRTKTEGGDNDRGPDSGSSKRVRAPTGPGNAQIRAVCTATPLTVRGFTKSD
eukprot:7021464-Lingulodinium_polyedra.AAC.1